MLSIAQDRDRDYFCDDEEYVVNNRYDTYGMECNNHEAPDNDNDNNDIVE